MTLKEYSEKIAELAKKYPEIKVVYAKDEEGNEFRPVGFEPTPGYYEDRDFTPESNFSVLEDDLKVNSICIN
jgi:hypothetical protein